ncbi:hypothetical protein LMG28614_06962 [Paraburkholderia ultramafica]|uniref:Uncharacterized protein n=1 Tax=Paraburkholderia ultramafica TaxID=1544867 RepID=A0A6S7CGI0_9BURK|nr:hypothetical protein [Paraburkholderia ultramafica]CAB3809153.1 hypothetical protein LMG28614_06962 [Paraburkholderia ultramafica]
MSGKDIARVADDADIGRWFATNAGNPPGVQRYQNRAGRTTTGLILLICWWSLVQLPLDVDVRESDMWMILIVAARLIVTVIGLAAVIDVRFAHASFSFLCSVSVLAIAPQLPLEFQRSLESALVLAIDCIGKAALILTICVQSLCEMPKEDSGRRKIG